VVWWSRCWGQSYLSVWDKILRQPYNGVCGHRELRSVGHNIDWASPGGRRWGNRVDGMPLGSALKNQHTPNQSLNHSCLHLKHVSEERCARYYALIVLLWLVYLSAARACLCRRGVVAFEAVRSQKSDIELTCMKLTLVFAIGRNHVRFRGNWTGAP